ARHLLSSSPGRNVFPLRGPANQGRSVVSDRFARPARLSERSSAAATWWPRRSMESSGSEAGIRSSDGRLVGDHTRIFLRPIASPLPLGLLALMCAGIMLSLEQLGAFSPRDYETVALVLLGFVV